MTRTGQYGASHVSDLLFVIYNKTRGKLNPGTANEGEITGQ